MTETPPTVGLFVTCLVDLFRPSVGFAAVALLERGDAEAVVFDRPMLRYIISGNPRLDFRISASEYRRQNYGFAVPKGSPLGERIGLEILRLRESGELLEIEQRWLGVR